MLDEATLKVAFEQYHRLIAAALPGEEELGEVTLSDRLERRMERLLRRQKKIYYPLVNTALKRVACIAAAVLLTGSAVAIGVGGARKEKSYFTIRTSETGVYATFLNTDVHPDTLDDPIIPRRPAYIPQGYALVEDRSNARETELIYEGEGYDCFYYAQMPNGSSEGGSTVDAEYKQIRLSDKHEGLLFIGETVTRLIFNDGEYLYLISGTLSEEEIIQIAESIE